MRPSTAPRGIIPAGLAQERFWYIDQLLPGTAVHNLAFAADIDGDLNVAAVEHAVHTIARRHEILRTRFVVRDGTLCLGAVEQTGPELAVSDCPTDDLDAATRTLATAPFGYEAGPMVRTALLKAAGPDAPARHRLVLVTHHAIFDGWSFGVFLAEFGALYRAHATGTDPELPPIDRQYRDYAAAQRERLASDGFAGDLAYWSGALVGLADTEPVTLPPDLARPARLRFRGGTHRFRVAADDLARLRTVADQESTTAFVTCLAALQAVLSHRTGRTDVVVGAPVAGRPDAAAERLIGPFLNVVVLRGDVSGDPTFRQLLVRGRAVTGDAFAHADPPLQYVAERLSARRGPAAAPFRVALALQNTPATALDLGAGLRQRPVRLDPETAQNDLSLFLTPTADGMDAMLVYDRDLFRPETVEAFAADLLDVLRRAGRSPDTPVSRWLRRAPSAAGPTLPAVLDGLTGHAGPGPDATLVARFRRWAAAQPERDALVHHDRRVSYGELDTSSDRIADALVAHGVPAGAPVALIADNHPAAIAALLGILKAGAAFACLDPRQPPARHAEILADLAPALLIVDDPERRTGPVPVLVLDELIRTGRADRPAQRPIDPETPAYVAYTSGSTGRPKGIPHRHRDLAQFVAWQSEAFEIGPGLRVGQLASLTFDVAYCEIFGALCHGATLCLRPPGATADPALLSAWLSNDRVQLLQVIPRLFDEILAAAGAAGLPELRTVMFVGEALHTERVDRVRGCLGDDVRLVNVYGPTEVVAATFHVVPATAAGPPDAVVPIGRPIPGRHLVLLDETGVPCRPGTVGEICIFSPYLADGYHRDARESARRFVPSPLPDRPGVMYRTGDLGRLRGGAPLLEFAGRLDNQVKINGIRLELEEVEASAVGHPQVRECAAAVRTAGAGQRLVAYVTTVDGSPVPDLRDHLRHSVPAHLVPAEVIVLAALPRTVSGKIDRGALPAPPTRPAPAGHVAPRTFLERTLAALVAEVLEVEQVGAHDDFFDIGGNSLQAARLVNRVRDELGLDLGLQALLDAPTVAGAAAAVQAAAGDIDYDEQLAAIERELDRMTADELSTLVRQHQPSTENQGSHDDRDS
ncbi:amino acid adenylation domain-containing protein [Plantactinospora sp. B6F1]|uniref:non-ribosomal peptide synthetase n=1 Tax=Plantactinospora sp. B6F1 TaxID=3158971 RepID=UPI0032D9516B